jgi:DNA-binding NarL/FixJ family response regulator
MKNVIRTRSRQHFKQENSRDPVKEKPRIRLVIADDDAIILHQLVSLLDSHFDVVACAENGRQLVEAVGKFLPQIVLADITMPEMNGIDAARQIKKTYPSVKVILVSGYIDDALIEGAIAAGVSGYVVKLQVFTELVPAIHAVLSGHTHFPGQVSHAPVRMRYASR